MSKKRTCTPPTRSVSPKSRKLGRDRGRPDLRRGSDPRRVLCSEAQPVSSRVPYDVRFAASARRFGRALKRELVRSALAAVPTGYSIVSTTKRHASTSCPSITAPTCTASPYSAAPWGSENWRRSSAFEQAGVSGALRQIGRNIPESAGVFIKRDRVGPRCLLMAGGKADGTRRGVDYSTRVRVQS